MSEPERSSAIEALSYDASTTTLSVRFVSGETYRYRDVLAPIAEAFQQAPSQGRFFAEHIRDRYSFEHQSNAPLKQKGRSLRSALLNSLD